MQVGLHQLGHPFGISTAPDNETVVDGQGDDALPEAAGLDRHHQVGVDPLQPQTEPTAQGAADWVVAAFDGPNDLGRLGLLGWPVSHSLSPAMHNAAFDYLSLDWRYVPMPVDARTPGVIQQAVAGLRALGLCGANVTVPHKRAALGRVRLQMNISNLFDRTDIIPSRLSTSPTAPDGFEIPGGRGVAYSRYDLVAPREFRFTTTYSF